MRFVATSNDLAVIHGAPHLLEQKQIHKTVRVVSTIQYSLAN